MACEWKTLPLEDCMSAIIDYRGKTPEKTTSGIPLVTAKVIKGGRIERPDEFISETDYAAWMRRGMPNPGDIVMTTEAPLGEVAQLDGRKVALAQRVITLRGKPGLLDNTFLKFLLQSSPIQAQLCSRSTGTTVVGIRQSELRKVRLTLPPFAEQQAIAGVLGALDDKIESSRRTSQTLERVARAIFRAWFVDFEPVKAKAAGARSFPGMLQEAFDALPTRLVESELRPMPEGWAVDHLDSIATVGSGKRPTGRSDTPTPECGVPLYGGGGRMGYTPVPLYEKPILFTGRVGTLGLIFRISAPSWPSDNTLIVEPQDGFFDFTYFWLKEFDLITLNRGSTQPLLTQTDLKRQRIIRPPEELVNWFASIVSPMFAKIDADLHESSKLASMRDYLLPKLLSGKVRVTEESVISILEPTAAAHQRRPGHE